MGYERNPLQVEELQAELGQFESKFGVPSSCLHEAFTEGGRLRETREFLRWEFVYSLLREAGRLPAPA